MLLKTSAASKRTSCDCRSVARHAFTAQLFGLLLPLFVRFRNASKFGSIRIPLQFRSRSKKRELLRWTPSQAPASMKKPFRFPSKYLSTRSAWCNWPCSTSAARNSLNFCFELILIEVFELILIEAAFELIQIEAFKLILIEAFEVFFLFKILEGCWTLVRR